MIWRILLNQWPAETSTWEDILRKQKETYDEWKVELITKPALHLEEHKKS